ncbi:hypothetical protein AOCH_004722 [Aspergillus ochraceoroseus]|uniref:gamma-glutamylcyclotransferase n=1 Tax=Aspergillus ochraceoroseus TaxID=138278 RepID=A0A0F8UBL7_9EURO|nr:hypothetical protein AOCH_004722 [Aspergillus ochraceoroseus]
MKHLYFAYGSNLSPTQMAMRCTVNPSRSAHPVAIACLTRWRWLICEVGYANVIPPAELCVGKQRTAAGAGKDDDGVFGVLYEMDAADEEILDGYEGVDTCSAGSGSGSGAPREVLRPREQGDGCYNKWFVRAKVVTWLDGGV